jgi:hypothetical protein
VNAQQLEARVLAIVDAVRDRQRIEDDLVECKRIWPDPAKAPRQLAAAANRAAGEAIIWIIGLDEDSGELRPRTDVDPADWWAQVSSRFDQVAPDLLHHLTVHVGPAETVVALAFGTDRTPYMIKTSGGSPEREVPIRDGTRTRSAYRLELLRMLTQATTVPPAELLQADLVAQWHAEQPARDHFPERHASSSLTSGIEIFIEHIGPGAVVLPSHQMKAVVKSGDLIVELQPWVPGVLLARDRPAPPPPPVGVVVHGSDVICTGPGRLALRLNGSTPKDCRTAWGEVEIWAFELTFGIVGAARPLRFTASLHRDRSNSGQSFGMSTPIGRWLLDE